VVGFIGLLKLVTTINYRATANSHILQSPTARANYSLSAVSSLAVAW
jgi:hypothetical protein